jgi:hypothetical protein
VSALSYMELCTCGHIRDEHHYGSPGVFGGCEMCRGSLIVHVFEGTGKYGDLHPGLGHLVDGEWTYDDAWKRFNDARFDRLFPSTAKRLREKRAVA